MYGQKTKVKYASTHQNDTGNHHRPLSVMFVCTANLCRSPVAEAVFQTALEKNGLGKSVRVHSAGTAIEDLGRKPDLWMRLVARLRGYRLTSRSRQVGRMHLDKVGLVVALGRSNLLDLYRIHPNPKSEIRLLSDFLSADWPRSVPDPINREHGIYIEVMNMIEAAVPAIVDHCRNRLDANPCSTNQSGS